MSDVSFREKLRSISFSHRHRGGTKTWAVTDERDGSVAGYQTESWDDSVSANVIAKPVNIQIKTEGQ
jgi:hypothetical protein